ncbi:MAG: SusC/RagA family TonB-linked outer membrane protein [Bacteroidota bacterium]
MNLKITDTIFLVFKMAGKTLIAFFLVINIALGNIGVAGTENPENTNQSEDLQQRITGNVVDETGEALPGATVLEKGTSNGTISDADGNFSLTVQGPNAVVQVSFVGYQPTEITVGTQSTINVNLEPDAEQLEEVVVIGYGTIKKRDLTGAVAQIDAAKISNQSPNSVTDILRANVPGLNVGFNNSPKGVSELQVRGQNSLTAGSSPLIVVDGMIYNGDLSDINPADIDKVDVMKDASSAAVYGARGANGVVLITTKRGEGQAPSINVASSFGIATSALDLHPYSPDGYAAWRTDVFNSINYGVDDKPGFFDNPNSLPGGVTLTDWLAYDGATGDPTTAWLNRIGFQDVEIGNYLAGKSVDWYDQIFHVGKRQDHSISLSGTKDEIKYYWSVGYTDNEGIVVGDRFTTIRSKLNLESKVNSWLTVGTNTQFANRDEGFVPMEWNMVYQDSPWGSELSDDGTTLRYSPQDDSGAGARHPNLRRKYTNRYAVYNTLNTRNYANIALPFGFSYQFAIANRFEWNDYYNHESSQSPEWATGTAYRDHTKISEWQTDNIIKWNKSFGQHNFDATFLAYAEHFQVYRDRTQGSLFDPNDNLGYHNLRLGASTLLNGDDEYDEKSTGDALMGRINYSFASKYLLSATIRRDGYSAFGPDNKRATFPSLAGGWVLSDESFFNVPVIDFLKARVSWGQNGNRNIGRYAYLSRLVAGKNLTVDGSGTVRSVAMLANRTMQNNTLQWERTVAWNYGIDFSLVEGRIQGSLDYYDMVTNDLLVDRSYLPLLALILYQLILAKFRIKDSKWSSTHKTFVEIIFHGIVP